MLKISRTNIALIFLFLAISVVAFIIRLYAFDNPIVGDEAVYAILGKKAIEGGKPYVDFYEMKPPLLFYIYGLGSKVFGWSSFGLRLLGLITVMINSTLIYFLVSKFSKWTIGLISAALALFFMGNIYIFATETVSEHFVVSFILSGFLLLSYATDQRNYKLLFFGGLLIAGAAMIKQTAAIFGLGAIFYLLLQNYLVNEQDRMPHIFKSVLMLAVGAITMIILCFLPVIFTGTISDARYWLIEFPQAYASAISWENGQGFLKIFAYRSIFYQPFTLIFFLCAIPTLFLNIQKRYFTLILILLLCSVVNIFPGFRFYGQYWIPLFILLPVLILPVIDTLKRFKVKHSYILISTILLFLFGADLIRNGNSYFAEDYMKNSRKAYYGNHIFEVDQMLDDLKARIKPADSFTVLGTEVHAYFKMDRFPEKPHIYPIIISRKNARNKVYQEEFLQDLKFSKYDYLYFSVKGLSWRAGSDWDKYLYTEVFNYVRLNYEPILVFNIDEKIFYNVANGDSFDWYKPNQLMTLKRKEKI